ncbi:uncharacterized protein LOC112553929 isoform X1 [Pomacea canaliculata]|uniref:uncharacterized protein LOC112553929 isoform X1 n=1 Tax=Pomacea canaliculata TaxID=400727 RepID=UPI000D732D66|nr:uncharacterized protein LOC112553929 isoform X1 [Pomacea canaliculata]
MAKSCRQANRRVCTSVNRTPLSTGTIFSTLEIKNARLKDAGFYVCRTSSLDVTSFRVNVLNDTVRTNERSRKLAEDVGKKKKLGALGGDTFNVKRGTENGRTEGMPDSHNAATQSSGLTLLLECVFFLGASFLFSVIT